jgi:hypothetical protein
MTDNPEIDAEVAFGEAFGTSFLVGVILKRLVQKGLFSNSEVADLIDQVLLKVESLQETKGAPKKSVARARTMLANSLSAFSSPRPRPQTH